jgi:hypothetical protein
MNVPVTQPKIQVNPASSAHCPVSISVRCLGPDLASLLASSPRPDDLLRSIFRVTVVPEPSQEVDCLPNMSGRYRLLEDEVQFIPHFPFERDVNYRASFAPRPLGTRHSEESSLEFVIPADVIPANDEAREHTKVTHVFPSCDLLPENLLRFYVCFSNPMQRGRARKEISLLDSDGQPIADALYRPPVELWDRTMRYLTVLLDPGRLKRWVGPNVTLGPPLKAGQKYILEIGAGLTDRYDRPLGETFRKHFLINDPVRERIAVENWKILPPATGSREALVLTFPTPLDWALLLRTITIRLPDRSVIDGQIVVDQHERRWSFIPNSFWARAVYHINVGSDLEDVCGNDMDGPFDRPIRKNSDPARQVEHSSLMFELT